VAGYIESRTQGRIDLAAHAPLSKPLAIYIEPTNICNFHKQCFFCAQSREDYRQTAGYSQFIPMEIVHKAIQDIRDMGGVKSIKIYFIGESTLHPQLGEIARLSCSVSSDVMLTTNGTKLDEKKSQELIDAGVNLIRFSIYEETKPSMQESILSNVKTLRNLRDSQGKTNPFIVVKWLSQNVEFGQWVQNAYKDVADDVVFEGMRNFANAFVALSSLTPLTPNRVGPQVACAKPFYELIVKANGDVAPCCAAWDQTLKVGNIMEESLLSIWRGERLARIHRLHLTGRRTELSTCSTCETLWENKDSVDGLSLEEYERRKR
jgi:radical SAM protein with 4Fe4S-binding SPASM domain